jgi:Helix-turn-helix domain
MHDVVFCPVCVLESWSGFALLILRDSSRVVERRLRDMKKNPPATTLEDNEQSISRAKSHCELILEHLQAGHTLTHIDALEKFRCWALSQRITDLRRKGHRILTEMVEVPSGKRIAQYRLES